MEKLDGELTFLSRNEEKKIKFCSDKRTQICIGSAIFCDIRFSAEEVDPEHLKIYKNESGKVIIHNLSSSNPILLNGEAIDGKKFLKSGDTIMIAGKEMRWESKNDAKRRTAALTKSQRKEFKHKFLKINKRITIHNVNMENNFDSSNKSPSSTEESSNDDSSKAISQSLHVENKKENPVNELNSSAPPVVAMGKENEKTPSKCAKLNLSGVLHTTYTPPARVARSVSKTPYNTPLRSPAVKSAAKSILNDSYNVQNTPASARKSMHLVDLTTPFVKRTEVTSTPRQLSIQKTPKTVGKTPLRNQTLLKSALKNSSIKKIVPGTSSIAQPPKQKILFESPAKDTSTSSIISIYSSVDEIESSKLSVIDSSMNCSLEKDALPATEIAKSEPADDVKDLLANISSVLEEKDESKALDASVESNFNNILEQQKDNISTTRDSLFDNVPIEAIDDFDKLVEDEDKMKTIEDPDKKAEIVLKMIENARESLSAAEANKTTQVLSSRYSNVTPNDSLVNTSANMSQKYDVATPKVSILDAVMSSARKSEIDGKLTISPVSRLSLANDATEAVENYQLNSNIQKSLRSTRKRIGTAMASLHNDSDVCNTTFDINNESLNMSLSKDVNDVSQVEGSNILSLDDQQQLPPLDSSNKENEYTETTTNNRISFYEYKETSEDKQDSKVIFEISNEEDEDYVESDSESSSSEDEEDDAFDDAEFLEEEHLDITDPNDLQAPPPPMAFRLSEQDLEEEGINPLEISKGELDIETQALDIQEDNHADHVEIPETQAFEFDDSIVVKEVDVTPNGTNENIQESANESIVELGDSTPINSQEPVNKSNDTAESISIQEISDTTVSENDICSQELRLKEEEMEVQQLDEEVQQQIEEVQPQIEEVQLQVEEVQPQVEEVQPQNEEVQPQVEKVQEELSQLECDDIIESSQEQQICQINSNEIVNKSIVDENACSADKTQETLDSNVSATINELIAAPSDILTEIAATQPYTSDDICTYEEHVEIPATQDILNESLEEEEKDTKSIEEDSAIASSNKIDQSEEEQTSEIKQDDDSALNATVTKGNESTIFSDSEFSGIDINASMFKRIESDEITFTQNSKELSDNKQESEDSERDIEKITTNDVEMDDDACEIVENTEKVANDDTSESNEQYKHIEEELARMNDEPSSKVDKKRPFSMLPLQNDVESDKAKDIASSSRKTMIPSSDVRRKSFLEDLEQEKIQMNEKDTIEIIEEKPKPIIEEDETPLAETCEEITDNQESNVTEDDNVLQSNEKESTEIVEEKPSPVNEDNQAPLAEAGEGSIDNQELSVAEDDNNKTFEIVHEKDTNDKESTGSTAQIIEDEVATEEKEPEPVVEEPCIKKHAYITTEDEKQAPETPSRRRVARINYSELATGSPARSRRGRSASTESNGGKKIEEPKSAIKQKPEVQMKMEPIVESEAPANETCEESPINQENVAVENAPTEVPQEESSIEQVVDATESEDAQIPEKQQEDVADIVPETKESEEVIESEPPVPETPSRRRVARINYSELATGSPARSRRGRSASTESNGGKKVEEPKSAIKQKPEVQMKMEPIVEDDITLQITVTATQNVQEDTTEDAAEDASEKPIENSEELPQDVLIEKIVEEIHDVQSEVTETEPQTTQIETEVTETEPEITETVSDATDTEQEVTETDPQTTQTVPEVTEIVSEISDTEPEVTEAVPETTETDPQNTQTEPEVTEIVSEISDTEPEVTETEPQTTETEATKSVPEITEPEIIEAVPEMTETKPEVIETQPQTTEDHSKFTETELEATEKEPEVEEAQAASEVTESENQVTENKPEATETSAETEENEPEVKNIEPPKETESQVGVNEPPVPDTPSRRRVARINYSELATGSPARSRRARSASTESNGKKVEEPKSAIKQRGAKQSKMEPIVEDSSKNVESVSDEKLEKAVDVQEKSSLPENVASHETQEPVKKRGRTPKASKIIETVSEESTPRRGKKLNKISEEKQVDAVPEVDSHNDDEKNKVAETNSEKAETKKRGRAAKVVEAVVEKAEEAADEKAEEPVKKRGRGAKAVEVVTEKAEEMAAEKVEEPAKKRGRGAKAVEVVTEKAEEMADEKVEEPAKKRGRGAKAVEVVTEKAEEVADEKVEEPVKKRGRGAKAVEVVAEKVKLPSRNTRREKSVQKDEVVAPKEDKKAKIEKLPETKEEEAKPVEEAPKTSGRGRKHKVEEVPDEPSKASEETEKTVKKRAGRAAKVVEEAKTTVPATPDTNAEQPTKKRAGRAAKLTESASVSEDVTEKVEEIAPKKGTKGKVDAVPVTNEEPEVKTAGRKRKQKVEEPSVVTEKTSEATAPKRGRKQEVPVEIQEQPKEEAPKTGRGRKNKAAEETVQKEPEVIEISSQNTQEEEKPVAKRGRGRQAKPVEEKAQKEPETPEIVEEKSVPKKGRGRQAKAPEEKTEEPTEVVKSSPKRGRKVEPEPVEQSVTKKSRGKQQKQQETEQPEHPKSPPAKRKAGKHVTIVTPSSTKQNKEQEEPAKRATKRQAQPAVVSEESGAAKRSTRGRK